MAFDCTYLLNPSVFYQAVAQKSSCSVHFQKIFFSVFSHALQEAVPQFTALWPERFIHGDTLNDDFSVMVRLRSLLLHFFVHSLFLLHRINPPLLIGIQKGILEYSFKKIFWKNKKGRNRMNYLQAHYCAAFAHSVPAYITYCYGIALTNRYYIVDPKEHLMELVG